jgi:hypothetical protein
MYECEACDGGEDTKDRGCGTRNTPNTLYAARHMLLRGNSTCPESVPVHALFLSPGQYPASHTHCLQSFMLQWLQHSHIFKMLWRKLQGQLPPSWVPGVVKLQGQLHPSWVPGVAQTTGAAAPIMGTRGGANYRGSCLHHGYPGWRKLQGQLPPSWVPGVAQNTGAAASIMGTGGKPPNCTEPA